MALVLTRETRGGVPLSYHRIVSVTGIVNHSTTVEVRSYVSKAKREEEARTLAEEGASYAYNETEFFELPYDPSMDCDGAYAWLKSQPGWEGAVDDADEVALEVAASVAEGTETEETE